MSKILDKAKDLAGKYLGIEFAGKEDRELMAFLIERYDEAFNNIREYASEWQENRRAYMAKPHEHYDNKSAVNLSGEKAAVFSSAITCDKVDDLVAIMLQNKPRCYPLPRTKDGFEVSETALAAVVPGEKPDPNKVHLVNQKIWSKVFESYFESNNEKEFLAEAYRDGFICGIVVTQQYNKFNYETGRLEPVSEIVQPEHVAFDPAAKKLKDAKYVFRKEYVTPFELMRDYPEFADEIKASVIGETDIGTGKSNIKTGSTIKESPKYKGRVCVAMAYYRDDTMVAKKSKVVETDDEGLEITSNVTELVLKYPKGRRITFLPKTSTKLKEDEMPSPKYPFAIFKPVPVSWSFYGRIVATPLRNLQHYDDRVAQQGFANMRAVGSYKVFAATGSMPDGLGDCPGEIIDVTRPGAVQPFAPQNILNNTIQQREMNRRDADNISGVTAPAEGSAPSLTSGKAVGLLQMASNRKLAPIQDIAGEFLRDRAEQIADLMLDTVKAGDKLRASDEDGIPASVPWDLAESTASVDMKVEADSALLIDPVSKFNMMTTLAQIPANLDGIVDSEAIAEGLSFPGVKDTQRRREARMEAAIQMQAAQGAPGQPQAPEGPGMVPAVPQGPPTQGMGVVPDQMAGLG
jgi:hypothetical protein